MVCLTNSHPLACPERLPFMPKLIRFDFKLVKGRLHILQSPNAIMFDQSFVIFNSESLAKPIIPF